MQDDAAIDLSVLASAEMTLREVLIPCREGVWTTRTSECPSGGDLHEEEGEIWKKSVLFQRIQFCFL